MTRPLKICKIGHPGLRHSCAQIKHSECGSPSMQSFVEEMVVPMRKAEGAGLAANQVGRNLAVMVLECVHNERYPGTENIALEKYLNPKIIEYSAEVVDGWEGCLSIPGYRGVVPRAKSVTFEAWTPEGEVVRKTVNDFHARIVQHEVDHLNGMFYVDRMPDLKTWMHLEEYNEAQEASIEEKE